MNGGRALILVGIAVFGVAAIELVEPGIAPLPGSEPFLSVIGLVMLLYAFVVFRSRRQNGPEHVETPEVECATLTAVPGTDLSDTLEGFPGTDRVYTGVFSTVRDGLREAAVAVLTRFEGETPEQARKRIEDGEWTSDQYAAGFLSDSVTPPHSLRERLQLLVNRESSQKRSLRRTVETIAEKADVSPETEGSTKSETKLREEEFETGTASRGTRRNTAGVQIRNQHRTHRWTGVSVVALLCLGVGLLAGEPAVLLAGVAGIGFAAYARSSSLGTVDLSVSRSLSEQTIDPGEEIEVTLTVKNDGRFCPNLRIIDGVPESLEVSSGSPRYGTVLRAGESVTVTYTVTARQGTHEFGPVLTVVRNLPGSSEQEMLIGEPSTIHSVPSPEPFTEPVPLRTQPTQYPGQTPTSSGGEGIEFRTVREYQSGDSMTRIDWKRRARTGELTTLEFRRERAARVIILIDVQPEARMGHGPDRETARERSLDAAHRIFLRLLADGHQVGIGTFGPQECYLPPDSTSSHRQRGRELLATHPAIHAAKGTLDAETYHYHWERKLRQQFPDTAQLFIISPLLSPPTIRKIRQFEAYGYPTTVLSPDPTATDTSTRRLMAAARRVLLADLRQAGIPVFDWQPSDTLEQTLKQGVKS